MLSDASYTESDNTQSRKPVKKLPTVQDKSESLVVLEGDNQKMERHGRGLGTKYLNRFIDQDGKTGELNG
jgi:hypothetical protein